MSRTITQNDRMPLHKFVCEAYEHTSGIARMDIRAGNVTVNGVMVTDCTAEVKDDDIVCVCGQTVKVDIPYWCRDSVRGKRMSLAILP